MEIAPEAIRFGDYVAVADLDLKHAENAKAQFGGKADVYQDYRKVIDRQDMDVVLCAVPDHWHTAINIAACKAGKDLYTEKPLTLTIDEGKILCRVVEETKRVVQVGTMQRSWQCFQTAVELVRNGRIGKLKSVTVTVPFHSTKGGPFSTQPVPPELDWELYQGQAPLHDYCPERTHTASAGGLSTPAGLPPIGAITTWTSPTGAWTRNFPARCRSKGPASSPMKMSPSSQTASRSIFQHSRPLFRKHGVSERFAAVV